MMEHHLNLSELKKQLTAAGLSTATPGLIGDDRYEELQHRWKLHQTVNRSIQPVTAAGIDASSTELSMTAAAPFALTNLSIGELRSRLNSLNESTSTPGLVGEERRAELMKRLIHAICGGEGNDLIDVAAEDEEEEEVRGRSENRKPPTEEAVEEVADVEKGPSLSDISSMKKEMKRISNRRAIAVAARLSGASKDPSLKSLETQIAAVDEEIRAYTLLQQQGVKKLDAAEIKSNFIKLRPTATRLETTVILERLENAKAEMKEKIRQQRQRIRDEADAHPEYGVALEEKYKLAISNANLATSKVIGTSSSSKKFTTPSSAAAAAVDAHKGPRQLLEENLPSKFQQPNEQRKNDEPIRAPPDVSRSRKITSSDSMRQQVDPPISEDMNEYAHSDSSAKMAERDATSEPFLGSAKEFNLMGARRNHNKQADSKSEDNGSLVKSDFLGIGVNLRDGGTVNTISPDRPATGEEMLQSSDIAQRVQYINDQSRSSAATVPNKPKLSAETAASPRRLLHASPPPPQRPVDAADAKESLDRTPPGFRTTTFNSEQDSYSDEGSKGSKKLEQKEFSCNELGIESMRIVPAPAESKLQFEVNQGIASDDDKMDDLDDFAAEMQQLVVDKGESNDSDDDVDEDPKGTHVRSSSTKLDRFAKNVDGVPVGNTQAQDELLLEREAQLQEIRQIKSLRQAARRLVARNDISAAELRYEEALELDPLNISTLEEFAVFLHQKKGALARAEAFFNRGLQVCLPGFYLQGAGNSSPPSRTGSTDCAEQLKGGDPHLSPQSGVNPNAELRIAAVRNAASSGEYHNQHLSPGAPDGDEDEDDVGLRSALMPSIMRTADSSNSWSSSSTQHNGNSKVTHIARFIVSYARFLDKARGDLTAAEALLRKGAEVAPRNPMLLANYGHFLGSMGIRERSEAALDYFQQAMKLSPGNPQYAMWYAQGLKKAGKMSEAELMYKVAYTQAVEAQKRRMQQQPQEQQQENNSTAHMEATALCNYATFLFKQRKDVDAASALFEDGLKKYPQHKGLLKNYQSLQQKTQQAKG